MLSNLEFLGHGGGFLIGLRDIVAFFLGSFFCCRQFNIGGMFSKSKADQKAEYDIKKWTPEQQELGKKFIQEYLMPKLGMGLQPYEGTLPGTGGPSPLQAKAFATAEGLDMGTPEDWTNRVNTYLEARRSFLGPTWEKQDALLKEKMGTMGLQHSSDVLKAQSDVLGGRAAEESMIGAEKYDQYEQMGLTVFPQLLANLGQMQREITEAGETAKFQEWLRTQAEYSPVIDQILAMLGMSPVQSGTVSKTGTTTTFGLEASGEYQ